MSNLISLIILLSYQAMAIPAPSKVPENMWPLFDIDTDSVPQGSVNKYWESSGASVACTASTPNRSLNSNFTPSATNPVYGCYTVSISCTISIAAGASCSGSVELRSDTSTTPTTVRTKTSIGSSGVLVIGLALTNSQEVPLCYVVPANHKVRLVSAGSATISISQQSEVLVDIN